MSDNFITDQDDSKTNHGKTSGVYSLRQRYLFVSLIIILLIFAFAWLAQSYASQSSRQHSHNIELRQQATQYLRLLRNELLHTEKGLESYMWEPSAAHREGIHHGIDSSLNYFEMLRQHEWFAANRLKSAMGDFVLDLKALHATLDRVMDMRLTNPGTLPERGQYNLNISHANRHFSSASKELQRITSPPLPQLATATQLWRQLDQQISEFEGGDSEPPAQTRQERMQKIEGLHSELDTVISQLSSNPLISDDKTRMSLLLEMQEALNLSHLSYTERRDNREGLNQRSDIYYLKHTVEPHFEHLWEYIHTLEQQLDHFSRDDARVANRTGDTIIKFVWILCFFGLTVISIAYIYFQRTVLRPIATIAMALKMDAHGEQVETLPEVHNLETRHLIDAYDEMRQQVQDRQQALEHIALHDSLTRLPNRYQLMSTLQGMCESFRSEGGVFAVMMLGLDRFKEVNDTLGQQTGDDILRKFGQRLRFLLRENDNVARYASDEFTVVLHHTDKEEALYVARKIRSELEQPFEVDGIELSISCSIGIALFPGHGVEREELTRRANIAMAIAKQHKSGITTYKQRYDTTSVERLSLAGKLRQAIQSGALELHYQAQYSAHSKRLSGLEVLCRWTDDELGPVSTEEFIPVAEQTGQVHELSEWVISTSLQQAMLWHSRGLDFGILSINISAFNLHARNFITMLERQLQQWNFPVEKLMLEVTESAMMVDPEHAIRTMRELHELGIKLSIDDYGTGYSSLAYVKQLPVDELKIDKSFVMEMTLNENDAVIVRSTIDLAHNLGLKVVAEGVDSQEKADLLEILDCDYLQGFHLGIPVPAQQTEVILPPLGRKGDKVRHIRDFR